MKTIDRASFTVRLVPETDIERRLLDYVIAGAIRDALPLVWSTFGEEVAPNRAIRWEKKGWSDEEDGYMTGSIVIEPSTDEPFDAMEFIAGYTHIPARFWVTSHMHKGDIEAGWEVAPCDKTNGKQSNVFPYPPVITIEAAA